jgi:hypothetical protein
MATTEYKALEPSGLSSFGVKAPSFTGVADSFLSVTTFIWMLAFSFIIGAAVWRFMLAGFIRMQPSEAERRKSNEMIKRVVLGLLGVFSLPLIILTINKGMLSGDVGLGDLKATSSSTASGVVQTIKPGTNSPPIPKYNDDPLGWGAIQNDSAVRSRLASLPNGGISINKTVCTHPVQTSCTTVGGLPAPTITMLEKLRTTCSGSIVITGGSESGHKSHGPGKTPVDLSLSSPGGLEACIRSFPPGPPKDFCRKTYQNFGYVFCDEWGVRHWHVFQ